MTRWEGQPRPTMTQQRLQDYTDALLFGVRGLYVIQSFGLNNTVEWFNIQLLAELKVLCHSEPTVFQVGLNRLFGVI